MLTFRSALMPFWISIRFSRFVSFCELHLYSPLYPRRVEYVDWQVWDCPCFQYVNSASTRIQHMFILLIARICIHCIVLWHVNHPCQEARVIFVFQFRLCGAGRPQLINSYSYFLSLLENSNHSGAATSVKASTLPSRKDFPDCPGAKEMSNREAGPQWRDGSPLMPDVARHRHRIL